MSTPTIPALEDITIGADPEFFLSHKGEKYLPAEVTGITGTKREPTKLKSGGAVQVDGCALEFNIQPAKSADEFVLNITSTLDEIRGIVDKDLMFDFTPAVIFTTDVWSKTSKESKELGCDPDYDAYTMEQKTPPQGSGDRPFRTGAGHIHIGFRKDADPSDPRHIYDCAILTQALDYSLGKMEMTWAKPNKRKELYGDYGSFRPKPYGFEYRVLGNDWVTKPNVTKFLFTRTREIILETLSGKFTYPIVKESSTRSELRHGGQLVMQHVAGRFKSVKGFIKKAYVSGELNLQGMNSWIRDDVNYYLHNYYNEC